VFATSDGGKTWLRDASASTTPRTPGVPRPAPNIDGGVPKGLRLQQTYFASPVLSWALASSTSGSTYLLRSGNGGRQWSLVPKIATRAA
jgi:hypothetical protein